MSRISKLSLTALLALATLAPVASAAPRVIIGGYFGPGFYGPAWYGWYGPAYYAPYGYAYAPRPNVGKVKIETKMKDAAVYVDGGYAGTVSQLKTFPLRGGNHNIELRAPDGRTLLKEQITVIAGKTAKLTLGY